MPPALRFSDESHPVLRGRDDVLDALVELGERAAEDRGGACTVVGEAGIGKTTLLDEVAARATRRGLRVIRLKGVEAEVELIWSGLAGLLDGTLDHLDHLPPARGAAIRSALALEGAGERVEPFAIAVASRDLLVELAEAAPILVLVDDLPWIDLATRNVLAYISDRLDVERCAIISTRRTGADPSTDTGPTIELTALSDDAAVEVLVDAGVTSPEARTTLIAAAGGIPMVLVEAAHMLDADERSGRAELPDPLRVGRSGQQAAELVLEGVTRPVRAALVVAAADPDGDLDRIADALAEQDLGLAELQAAEAAGVVGIDGPHVTFRHPLLRSAAYYDAPRAAQRAAHRSLSRTLPDASPIRAWHLARAALGPDEEVASALDDAAAATARRGAPALAARSWELASRLSPEAAGRARRLRLAGAASLDAGMSAEAGILLDRADAVIAENPDADELIERIHRRQLRCRLPLSKGGIAQPAAGLRAMAGEAVAAGDPGVAVDLVFTALEEYIREGAFADIADTVKEAVALRDVVDDDRARRIDIADGALLVLRGDPAGEPLVDRYRELVGADRSDADTRFLAEVVGPALGFFRRTDASDVLLSALEADLRSRGAVRPLVDVLGAQAMAHYSRSFPAALAAATEAVSLAEGDGAPESASLAAGVLALCTAVLGDRAGCERAAALLRDVPEPERRVLGPVGLAYLALNEGRLDDADAIYREIVTVSPIGRGLIRWETEWVETLARAGRRDEAAALFHQLVADVRPDLLTRQERMRIEGLLADDDEVADECFARSIAAAVTIGNPFAEGRVQLLWGEQLRRARRRAEARVHLERATELFRAVGATVFADRAATELRAAGGTIADDGAPHRLLTPHELQVARLVVGGASNRDLAAKLFISPRTVESHLTSIFRKLGVRNRQELAARAIDDPILQP